MVLAALLLAVLSLGVGSATAASDINQCTTITSQNAPNDGLVRLTSDISESGDDCVEIQTSDIVFDGQGHLISGNGDDTPYGIIVKNPNGPIQNVTVRNVRVDGWTDAGVGYEGSWED